MRVLFLSQFFQPEHMFKGLPLAKALRDRGHEVEVLTGFPNYPGGKLYDGYKIRPWQRETIDGIRVNRVALYPSHDRNTTRRMLNYLSFGASAAVLGPWLVRKPDVVYVYNLVTLGFAARLLRHFKSCRIVLDVEDLWPESVTGSGMMKNAVLLRMLERWCRSEYASPDRLVVLSPGFKRNLEARAIPGDKIDVVYNWCDETSLTVPPPDKELAKQLGFAGRFNIVFAGTMGIVQSLDAVLAAAKQLSQQDPGILFTFVGGGVEVDRLKKASAALPNVQFLPRQPLEEIGRILSISDALLVHLADDPLFSITIPSKIQAYMYAGRPILCGIRGDAADLVRQAKAGVSFTPEDPDSLVDAILKLRKLPAEDRERMGADGRAYYRQHLSLSAGVEQLEKVLERTVARPAVVARPNFGPGCSRNAAWSYFFWKRVLDIVVASAGLLLLSPFLLLIALAIRLTMGGPVLFRQRRPGLHGQSFTIYKFRTMSDGRRADGTVLPDNQRLSALGKFLRATSLDELPELFNVLCGEMSLVGPRPLLMQYLERFTPEQARRHEVKPGITGWAQIQGRNAISWDEKFRLDIWYVDHPSFWLDIKILFRTLWTVVQRQGVNASSEVTMPEFMGSQFQQKDAP